MPFFDKGINFSHVFLYFFLVRFLLMLPVSSLTSLGRHEVASLCLVWCFGSPMQLYISKSGLARCQHFYRLVFIFTQVLFLLCKLQLCSFAQMTFRQGINSLLSFIKFSCLHHSALSFPMFRISSLTSLWKHGCLSCVCCICGHAHLKMSKLAILSSTIKCTISY